MKRMNEKLQWSLLVGAASTLAILLAQKSLKGGWRWYWGDDPPENPAAPDVTWLQAIAWASATGAAMALARLLAMRGTAAGWRSVKGTLPPI
jgi:hypothetical protein